MSNLHINHGLFFVGGHCTVLLFTFSSITSLLEHTDVQLTKFWIFCGKKNSTKLFFDLVYGDLSNVLGSSSIWTRQISNICDFFFLLQALQKDSNFYLQHCLIQIFETICFLELGPLFDPTYSNHCKLNIYFKNCGNILTGNNRYSIGCASL